MNANQQSATYAGIPLRVSVLAVQRVSGRQFPFKQWMARRCYPKRMQKKNDRKHGPLKYAPASFEMRDPFTGGRILMVHPEIFAALSASGALR